MEILQVMNFLNEIANQFDEAISLASGRPNPQFYQRDQFEKYTQIFVKAYADTHQLSQAQVQTRLCEYGPASGIINPIISRYLGVDENINVQSSDIVVTNGFQEAVTLLCLHLLQDQNDCVLTLDPSYIGLSALVLSIGKKVVPIAVEALAVADDLQQIDFELLVAQVALIKQRGLNPKAIYINPDFNNPMAYHLSLSQRQKLLAVCHGLNLPIIEDSPYASFHYDGDKLPSLKALDPHDLVYHIGSFAKTFCPGVRVGYLIIPTAKPAVRDALVSLKSLVSVNTSAISQAIVGGFLIANDFSVTKHLEPICAQYRTQRDALAVALQTYFVDTPQVSWQIPAGGFFAIVDLPFEFDEAAVYDCAEKAKVICMPVSFFCLIKGSRSRQVRLSFSYYQPQQLSEGVKRFAQYVNTMISNSAISTTISTTSGGLNE